MTEQTWTGLWWLPETPDQPKHGILRHEPYGDLRLDLIGGFSIDTRTPQPDGSVAIGFDGRWPIVHGLAKNIEFTLLDASATHTGGGFAGGSITEQTISAIRVLEGIHLTSVDEPAFADAEIEIEYLLGWVARTSISSSMEFEGRWNGKQTLTTTPVEEQTATFEDLTFTLRVPHEQFRIETQHAGNRRSVANREFAVIDIEAKSALSLDDIDRLSKALQDLVTFVATEPAGVLRRTLGPLPDPNDPEGFVQLVQVHGRQIFTPGSGRASDRPHHEYLFTLDAVEFDKLVPKWLALHRSAQLPLSMLFGTKYAPAPYTPVNLLTVAAAAEGLHRCLHDRVPLDADVFEAAEKALLAAVPGKANSSVRKLVHEQFHNTLTYRERLEELAALPDQLAVTRMLTNINAWISRLTRARNGTAHADDTQAGSRPDGAAISWLTDITYYFVCLVLLAELDISPAQQEEITKLQKTIFAIGEFERILKSSD